MTAPIPEPSEASAFSTPAQIAAWVMARYADTEMGTLDAVVLAAERAFAAGQQATPVSTVAGKTPDEIAAVAVGRDRVGDAVLCAGDRKVVLVAAPYLGKANENAWFDHVRAILGYLLTDVARDADRQGYERARREAEARAGVPQPTETAPVRPDTYRKGFADGYQEGTAEKPEVLAEREQAAREQGRQEGRAEGERSGIVQGVRLACSLVAKTHADHQRRLSALEQQRVALTHAAVAEGNVIDRLTDEIRRLEGEGKADG